MDWRKRLLKKMDEHSITKTDLCQIAGVSSGSLNLALKGNHDLKLNTMKKLADVLHTTPIWLYYGDNQVLSERVPLCQSAEAVFQFTEAMTECQINQLLTRDDIPFVQLGGARKSKKEQFGWRISQQDMGPALSAGDIVIIDQLGEEVTQWVQDVFVMVAWLNKPGKLDDGFREVFIQRLCRSHGERHLQSMDTRIPTIEWDKRQDELHLCGFVVQAISQLLEDVNSTKTVT